MKRFKILAVCAVAAALILSSSYCLAGYPAAADMQNVRPIPQAMIPGVAKSRDARESRRPWNLRPTGLPPSRCGYPSATQVTRRGRCRSRETPRSPRIRSRAGPDPLRNRSNRPSGPHRGRCKSGKPLGRRRPGQSCPTRWNRVEPARPTRGCRCQQLGRAGSLGTWTNSPPAGAYQSLLLVGVISLARRLR